MSIPFYAKSEENQGFIKNMEVVGFDDLNGYMGFEMALHKTDDGRYYLYVGSFKGPGFNIIDVTDPSHPRNVKFFDVVDRTKYKRQNTPKIQAADGLLLVVLGGGIPKLQGVKEGEIGIKGLNIYDIKTDPENPKLLSHWETGTNQLGVHRFAYNGGKYVYMPAEAPGFVGFIVRILDISDPEHPVEAGRWWMPEQFKNGMMPGTYPTGHEDEKDWAMCHACTLSADRSDQLFMGYFGGGGVMLDISDPTLPVLLGRIKLQPPFAGKHCGARCHTYLPLTGRNYAVLTNEGERFPVYSKEIIENSGKNSGAQPMNNLHMIDISDPADPTLIAEFPYPTVPEGFPFPNFNICHLGCQGPFGPHNVHEPMGKPWLQDDPNLVYCCYFHAGMRVYDVSDPYYIKEIAYFIPPNPEHPLFDVEMQSKLLATAEDCTVDDRGYIYMDTFHDGLYILRLTR